MFLLLLAVFIPEVMKQNKIADRIMWKDKNIGNFENGSMYQKKGYAVSESDIKQSRFGNSLTSRYRQSARWNNTYYIAAGAARMETDEKTVIGELNDSGLWINGRLEIDKDTNRILYRKYDEDGKIIKNLTDVYVGFKWQKFNPIKKDKVQSVFFQINTIAVA